MSYLQVDSVTTILNEKKLLDNISFSIEKGKVLALVGHNGAGKSTLIKTIMKIIDKYEGRITIQKRYDQDENLLAFKRNLSYLPEEPMLLTELTVMQHFQLYAQSYEMPQSLFDDRVVKYVKGFSLEGRLDAYPNELSKGMRQKTQAICSLLPDVAVLLVDEPFMGLDIYSIDYFLELLKAKIDGGTSVLLTTHQLGQLKNLADEFILLDQGKIVSSGPITKFDTITRGNS